MLVGLHVYSYFSETPVINFIGVLSILLAVGIVIASLILASDKKSTYLDEEFSDEYDLEKEKLDKGPNRQVMVLGVSGLTAARGISTFLKAIDPTGRVEYNLGYFVAHLLLIPCFIFFWLLVLGYLLP